MGRLALLSVVCATTAFLYIHQVVGHGVLMDPPMRSLMWQFGYDTPHNYNPGGLNCGGYDAQWQDFNGECGECGDPVNVARPRPNENGGEYGNAIIVKEYKEGQVINVLVDLYANHGGYFEFRLCPVNDPKKLEDQSCFDQHLLKTVDGSTQYWSNGNVDGNYTVSLQLPEGLTCSQCVLQWYWRCSNRYGDCNNGTMSGGCGPQETYRNCADIAIL